MNLKPIIAATAAAAVLAGGFVVASAVGLFGPAEDEAVALVPADTFMYGNVFLDPSNPQKLALRDLLAKFPEASTPEEAKAAIARLLDEGLSELGMTFAADVEPWLGSQIAFFVQAPQNVAAAQTSGELTMSEDPGVAVLIASDDEAATQAALDKALASPEASQQPMTPASYNGVEYKVSVTDGQAAGVVDGFLVFGNETGLKSVADARSGDALGDSDAYSDAVGDLTEDRLATFYIDPSAALAGSGLPPGMMGSFGQTGPVASALYARSDAVVFETSSASVGSLPVGGTDVIDRLPGEAWAAFGIPSFGQTLEQLLAAVAGSMPGAAPGAGTDMLEGAFEMQFGMSLRDDLLSWLGDVGLFVQGTELRSLGGGAVIRATDPAKAAAALPRIKAALQRFGASVKPLELDGFDGFALRDRSMPDAVNVVLADERVLITFGRDATLAALGSDPSLGGTEGFAAARSSLGDGFAVSGYVNIDLVTDLIGSFPGIDAIYRQDVQPFLDPLSFMVFGTHTEGDSVVSRVVIGVR